MAIRSSKGEKVKATVGIITYRRPDAVKRCLKAVMNQATKPKEIIVVDSSENDKTERIVEKAEVTYKHFRKRLYLPKARNIILKSCGTEIIAYLDDDAIPTPHWLENIIKGYSKPEIAGVGGPCINVDETFAIKERIITGQKNRNYFKSTGDIRCDGRRWIPPKATETQIMMGGNMSYLTSKLREVSGFDEHYDLPCFREETDVQMALIRKGYNFKYMPKAIVWHLQEKRGGIADIKQSDYYCRCGKNHKYFCDKYFSKLKSRLSWIFWSISPPCLWLAIALAIIRRDRRYLGWIRGLFW